MFITAVPITKLLARGGDGGHVLRETTSRGPCELVCPSRTGGICKIQSVLCVYYCSTYYKAAREGGGGGMEDMCYERLRAEADVN